METKKDELFGKVTHYLKNGGMPTKHTVITFS